MEDQDSVDWLHLVSELPMGTMTVAVLCTVLQSGCRLHAAASL